MCMYEVYLWLVQGSSHWKTTQSHRSSRLCLVSLRLLIALNMFSWMWPRLRREYTNYRIGLLQSKQTDNYSMGYLFTKYRNIYTYNGQGMYHLSMGIFYCLKKQQIKNLSLGGNEWYSYKLQTVKTKKWQFSRHIYHMVCFYFEAT